jgi:catechol 2,3-dioxygenase-like lactoylglutathione lyase family enzyme
MTEPASDPGLTFERMTVFVSDMERSVSFYRDIVGLVVTEDKTIEGAAAGALLQLPPCTMRIVFLGPSADAPMVLGLFEVTGTPMKTLDIPKGPPAYGQTALLLHAKDFEGVCARLTAAGTPMLTKPLQYRKMSSSPGSPPGIYNEAIAYDPDGVLFGVWRLDPLGDGE